MKEFMPERRSSLYRHLCSTMFYHVSAMMVRHHSDNGTDEIIVRCGAISMGQIHNEFSTQVQNTGMRYRCVQ